MRRLLLCIMLAPATVLVPLNARAAVPAGASFTAVRAPHPMALDPSSTTTVTLRRISLDAPIDAESNLSISVRSINGLGGFAPQAGTNVAFAYHRRFRNGDEIFANYGTSAAFTTLHRFILKFVFHVNGDAGT